MKKILILIASAFMSAGVFAQEIGHFQQIATVRLEDDVMFIEAFDVEILGALTMELLNIFTPLFISIKLPTPAVSSTSPVVEVSRRPPPAVRLMFPVEAVVRVRLFAPVEFNAIPCPASVSEDEDDRPVAFEMEKLDRFTF